MRAGWQTRFAQPVALAVQPANPVPDSACVFACRLADAVLRNLWRWLCSPSAALAAPPLQRHVARLMRKLLAQLVADLRRLGAQARCSAETLRFQGVGAQLICVPMEGLAHGFE